MADSLLTVRDLMDRLSLGRAGSSNPRNTSLSDGGWIIRLAARGGTYRQIADTVDLSTSAVGIVVKPWGA